MSRKWYVFNELAHLATILSTPGYIPGGAQKYHRELNKKVKKYLPEATRFNRDKSRGDRLVFDIPWNGRQVIITPSLVDLFTLRVTGTDKSVQDGWRKYATSELYKAAFEQEIEREEEENEHQTISQRSANQGSESYQGS